MDFTTILDFFSTALQRLINYLTLHFAILRP